MTHIIIGSEGKGSWGEKVLFYFLSRLYPSASYEIKNSDDAIIIISSHFASVEPAWNKKKKKYIYWSGESDAPNKSPYETKSLYMLSAASNLKNYMYIPFILYSCHLYKERKYQNIARPYLLAYCNSRFVLERENIFNLFVEKAGADTCHSYSNCHGKYINTKKESIPGTFQSDNVIDTYKNYKFVIAMENANIDGYVTEKIVNAFYSGAIPIYWGSSNINEFFNEKAFINVSNFKSFEDCVNHVCNMTDEEIKQMTEEPVYKNNDLIHLLDDEYNSKNENKVLSSYLKQFDDFITNSE